LCFNGTSLFFGCEEDRGNRARLGAIASERLRQTGCMD
jgi:hypothetical protein